MPSALPLLALRTMTAILLWILVLPELYRRSGFASVPSRFRIIRSVSGDAGQEAPQYPGDHIRSANLGLHPYAANLRAMRFRCETPMSLRTGAHETDENRIAMMLSLLASTLSCQHSNEISISFIQTKKIILQLLPGPAR
jgi:hypothetical protein